MNEHQKFFYDFADGIIKMKRAYSLHHCKGTFSVTVEAVEESIMLKLGLPREYQVEHGVNPRTGMSCDRVLIAGIPVYLQHVDISRIVQRPWDLEKLP